VDCGGGVGGVAEGASRELVVLGGWLFGICALLIEKTQPPASVRAETSAVYMSPKPLNPQHTRDDGDAVVEVRRLEELVDDVAGPVLGHAPHLVVGRRGARCGVRPSGGIEWLLPLLLLLLLLAAPPSCKQNQYQLQTGCKPHIKHHRHHVHQPTLA